MSHSKYLQQVFGTIVVIVLLAGCNMPVAAPSPAPALSPQSPPPTFPPPATPVQAGQSTQAAGQPELFKLIQTVQVTPDDQFLIGGFARIGYVPATDSFAVVFGTQFVHPEETGCPSKGHAYKVYTLDMQPTGKSGALNCGVADSGGVMVDNTYYDVTMHAENGSFGWRIIKYDAVTWKSLANIFYVVQSPQEGTGDPLVNYVNGQLDVASGYTEDGNPPPPDEGAASHHNFFSPALELLGKRRLSDTPHRSEGAMIYVDGVYSYVTSNSYLGDMIVMQYDKDWKYLGSKELRQQTHFSTGVVFDGQRFYVAFLDTSQREVGTMFPIGTNTHLAAFDRDWNLIQDTAVTNFAARDQIAGRPWVILHGNRLYVSYDVTPLEPGTGKELLDQIEAFVSVYELAQKP